MHSEQPIPLARWADLGYLGRVCRLGLASRGNTQLDPDDVLASIERGVNYLNWCGHADGLSQAMRQLGPRRRDVVLAVQLGARSADEARRELDQLLAECDCDYFDVVTYYYVEERSEWQTIVGPGGAATALEQARDEGLVRAIGLTSHQRALAAEWAGSGKLDLLMVRYNAAHRGAEQDVFPVCQRLNLPVVTYTSIRWGALLQPTPDDPPETVLPTAPECYQFVLAHPGVSVVLMSPDGPDELAQDLQLLDDWQPFTAPRYEAISQHGQRVRQHGGAFP